MGKRRTSRSQRGQPRLSVAAAWGFFRTNALLTEDSDFTRALDAIRRAAADCEQSYAIIGAVALNAYGYNRFTEDIDLLISPTFAEFLKTDGSRYQLDVRGQAVLLIRHEPTGVEIKAVLQGRRPVDASEYVFPDPPKSPWARTAWRTWRH